MKCITNLAISNDKKNKIRSILIIFAILLTTMLLTMIGTFCYGSIKFSHKNAGYQYGNFYGAFTNITDAQIHEMKLRSEFTDIGLMANAGTVKSDKNIRLYWVDDTVIKLVNINRNLIVGTFPQRVNEITASKSFFKAMGCENPQIGTKITLQCRNDNNSKFMSHRFKISGLIKDRSDSLEGKNYYVYISKNYYESQVLKEMQVFSAYFALNKDVPITSDNAKKVLTKLADKCGIEQKQVLVNTYYLIWKLDPGTETIVSGLFLALCIIIFSVIVIYNIFQVGLTQKIQEYGKIKAVGATKRQLRRIIFREGMILALIGIPNGLLFGYIIADISFAWMLQQAKLIQQGREMIQVSIFSVPLLIGVGMISFLTIWLALKKPMKIVAEISPIEAIRYQEKNSQKAYIRKGYQLMGTKEMTLAAIASNKKRTIRTVCTMGLSCVLFVTIASFVGNIDDEYEARQSVEYGQFVISLDYSLDDKVYKENNLDSVLNKNPLSQATVEQIKRLNGVTTVKTRNLLAFKKGNHLDSVTVLDQEGFEHLKKGGAGIGNLDYKVAAKKNSIFYGWSHFLKEDGLSINQNVKAFLYGNKKAASYKGVLQGAFGNCGTTWAITDQTYKNLGSVTDNIGFVWVDCDQKDVTKVKNELNQLFADKEHIEIETYEHVLSVSKISTRFLKLICYTVLGVVGIIGFMNMANTMIISIITRKREFGVLQAIGMTNKQLNFMLQMEGIIYTFGTVLVAMMVGVPAGYGVFRYGRSHGFVGIYIYHFPWKEILIMVLILAAMQMVLSFILSKNVRKESLVERIRYQE
jgi:ABC-type transport system, involved in lipoprotein release, permease component